MRKGWSEVALGEVVEDVARFEAPQPGVQYRQLGVRLWGEGAYEREPIDGGDTQYSAFNRCETGDMVVNRIWARSGSVSVVPPELSGSFVSTEFPLYRAKSSVLPGWLRLITKARWFWTACDEKARGTSGKNRIKPSSLLEIRIPLPSLAEQQRLVAHLDAIESRLTRAQNLREEEQRDNLALVTSLAHRWELDAASKQRRGWQKVALGNLLEQTSEIVAVDSTASYPNIGIYSYGRGTFTKSPIEGANTSATQLFRVKAGQFIYSRLFAFEGAYALVQPSQDGHYVSNEFPTFELDSQRILPEFLFAYFKSSTVWKELAEQSTGLGNRRQRIHPDVILAREIDLPPIEYQTKVRDAFLKLEQAQSSAGAAEVNALLPSLLDRIFNS